MLSHKLLFTIFLCCFSSFWRILQKKKITLCFPQKKRTVTKLTILLRHYKSLYVRQKTYNTSINVASSCYPVRDPLSLDQKTHCSGRASFRETERQGRGKKRINPFLRKISGCPFRVGCGWRSFLSHIFLCQWLDPRCIASLPWAARCTVLCSSHPASIPILHRLYGDLLRRDKEIPLFL